MRTRTRRMRWAWALLALLPWAGAAPAGEQEYLYQRDVEVPAFQTLREFFDMPDRPGAYLVTLVSEAIGPLTFRVLRAHGDAEQVVRRKRSYHVKSHEFQVRFDNPKGADDLIVEVSNSNPAAGAKVTVFVVELRK